ncbi:MAG: Peptidase M23 [Candidatus Campbellbacteria bacterium GW2011_GWD1_35_49]|nr:MAG: Lysozyme-like protein-like protein [Candidatus Campbellbacteria bacterium GW2011_OD1_34_28]KKP74630.1 MAG: Peptidase M23 [Candidatus Campbellbacteria bacterium GW2011_GWD2_35_24]KKP76762.1 MAG: Peptidase M23 [Candidatus Campbellbacteria bacterium GW2011_GWC1_35_31]KKP78667.1 MAG: Peptidase M23 [Candidatus Campbellbacteria bacterium GW2011_GWD1_35_49]HAP74389.1 hypothetical protein [Candidatus Campbellbacteria bacterium]
MKKSTKGLSIILLMVVFLVFPNLTKSEVTCSINLDGKTDEELQIALKKCEEEIAEQNALLQQKQRESVTIERDIDIINSKITKTQADIRAKDIKIYQLKQGISSKKETLTELNNRSERTLESISGIIKKTNELDDFSVVEALLSQESISEFFVDFDDFDILESDLQNNLMAIRQIKGETMTAQQILEEQQRNELALKIAKEEEKRKAEAYKSENKKLLSVNRAQEDEYKKTIAEKERIKNEIRNRIFRTVGGTEMKFGEALRLIQPYEDAIGIESALVLAVLTQESAIDGVIGKNLGRCTYNQTASNSAGTVMSNSQKPSFLAIMKELGMDPDTTPVSCPIYGDGNYGGAMGPSQFMPRTWYDIDTGYGYKTRVAKILGISAPSPFVNLDAFVGTASYLSDARASCSAKFTSQFEIWSCSAARYYAGGNYAKHMYSKYSYGYKVAERAMQFQKDIDTLDL